MSPFQYYPRYTTDMGTVIQDFLYHHFDVLCPLSHNLSLVLSISLSLPHAAILRRWTTAQARRLGNCQLPRQRARKEKHLQQRKQSRLPNSGALRVVSTHIFTHVHATHTHSHMTHDTRTHDPPRLPLSHRRTHTTHTTAPTRTLSHTGTRTYRPHQHTCIRIHICICIYIHAYVRRKGRHERRAR